MAINKVVYGNNTLIDLTNDTVEASNLLEGVTAHDRSGTPVNGTAKQGHTIKDGDGTAMTPQPNLQFADAKVTNDSANNATVVRNFVDIDWDDWQEVDDNDDTYYRVTDAPLVDGNVEIDLMTKLWENPAPTASFVAQNITLASDDYDSTLWVARYSNDGTYCAPPILCKKGDSPVFTIARATNYGARSFDRVVSRISDTSYGIGHCNMSQGAGTASEQDTYLIPYIVYGIKQKVSISLSAIISNVSTSASKCMLSDGETSVEDALNYSTEEHVIGKWIDGSTLYEKTVDCGALPNSTTKYVAHNISNLNHVILVNGIGIGNTYIPLPWISTSNQCTIYVRNTNVVIVGNDDLSSYNGYVTIRYTKTS